MPPKRKAHDMAYVLSFKKVKAMSASEPTHLLKDTLRDDCLDSLRSACFIPKKELPLKLFSKLLSLEEKHSVETGTIYQNSNYGGHIIEYISGKLANILKLNLKMQIFKMFSHMVQQMPLSQKRKSSSQ